MDSFARDWRKLKNSSYYRDLRRMREIVNKTTVEIKKPRNDEPDNHPERNDEADNHPEMNKNSGDNNYLEFEEQINDPFLKIFTPEDDIQDEIDDDKNENNLFDFVEDENDGVLQQKLNVWCIENRITHMAVKGLLTILNDHRNERIPKFPKDPRTFLETPRTTEITHLNDGDYWHQGLIVCLQNYFENLQESMDISLIINIDGLPLHHGMFVFITQFFDIVSFNSDLLIIFYIYL